MVRSTAVEEMSSAVTCHPVLASQRVSAPWPDPASNALAGWVAASDIVYLSASVGWADQFGSRLE